MKNYIVVVFMGLLILGCNTSAVEPAEKGNVDPVTVSKSEIGTAKKLSNSLKPLKKVNTKVLKEGISITYFVHGNGRTLQDADVVKLNYEVLLEDGTLVDGNKLLNKDWLPFIVGFGMQTPGWDIALRTLKVGDFVEIFLPAKMARGEKGIKGLIPPNSNNVLRIKVLGLLPETNEIDGTKVWLLEENETEKRKAQLEDEVDFHYIVGTKSRPKYEISYRKNRPYTMRFDDYGVIRGLKKSLINAKRSDKIWVLVPPEEAYGAKGLLDKVKPNEQVFYDIFVLDVR